uniref:Fibulin 2 n=1 Tax=Labrus bergylta TaxID=56723 RepID=A0A3Q3LPH2_9LABR
MAFIVRAEGTLVRITFLFLYLSVGSCQRDCTGVDCPQLENCIEEGLESGACCASCLQKGCTCEGYQYYDCVNAGFKNGKVPDGDSYFVDYGSTECSCPAGGGRISCNFISCPDLPPNCIEVSEPMDSCMQCERVGCVQDGQKYDAGHSFHIDACQVCHCPTEGGNLMCYPVPDCDPQKVKNTMLALPLYKEDPEDYDYGPIESPENYHQSLVFSTQPPSSNKVPSVSRGSDRPDRTAALQGFDRQNKLELRERYGVHHPEDRGEVTESPPRGEPSTVRPHMHTGATTSWQPSQGLDSAHHQASSNGQKESLMTVTSDIEERVEEEQMEEEEEEEEEVVTFHSVTGPEGRDVASELEPTQRGGINEEPESSDPTSSYQKTTPEPSTSPGVSAEDLLQSCCAAGQRWASENHHCNNMPILNNDKQSLFIITFVDGAKQITISVCCSCCALGLRLRAEGRGCDAHQYLGYPCGHVFLTCCEEGESSLQIQLRRKQMPRPTALPRKGTEHSKEAFSISATDEAANTVEEQEDVDECQLYAGQLCQHTCTNIWGSYRCECHQGYILQQDGHSCAPGTFTHLARISPPETSTKAPSSIDSCFFLVLSPTENGPCSQHCTAVAGRARCSCFPGFSLMMDRHTCEDVDECVTNTHSCRPSEHCVNTVGSFVCELRVTCPAGYQLRNSVCEDIDECVLRTHNCRMGFVCKNTMGSFLCNPKQKCMSGFTQDSHSNCIDINECSSLSEPCSSGSHCINTVGSYTCQQKTIMCSPGYHASPDGSKCVDIDECQMGTHRCGVGQICHNLPGSYRCDCQTGYQYDALRKACNDVNECWRYPGRLCAQTCENTPGSYHCSCTAGFSLAFDGKNCEDVNECEKNPCSQECANIYGSYQCYCRQGYYLKEDGHTCEDIDECSQSIGNLCAFQCVNVAGSYKCACPPHGYSMSTNGHTCRDIDECTAGTHNCSLTQTCYNLQGGFRCLSFNCPPNYKRVSDTRCERTSCPANSLDCQNSPVRITYYQLSFQTNIIIPAQIFRIGPSPAYTGDRITISIIKGNEESYFSTRKLNSFTGAVYLQRQVRKPKDFLIDVEMKLLRQGSFTSFLTRIYVFITSSTI